MLTARRFTSGDVAARSKAAVSLMGRSDQETRTQWGSLTRDDLTLRR
jgi:hypothetical protein